MASRLAALLALLVSLASARESGLVEAEGSLQAVHIAGQVQIRWVDAKGRHVLTVDSNERFPEGLPADAELTVLDADASFRCGGALLLAIPGTIFSAGESKGVEYVFVRQGELAVKRRDGTTVLNRQNPHVSYRRGRRVEDPAQWHLR